MSISHGSQDYIVFSVYQDNKQEMINAIHHGALLLYLDHANIEYKVIQGCYNGQVELSIITNAKHFDELQHFMIENRQETYLYLTPHKHGLYESFLLTPTEKPTKINFIGYMRSVPEPIAKEQSNYSYRPDLGRYFVVSPTDNTQDNTYGGLTS